MKNAIPQILTLVAAVGLSGGVSTAAEKSFTIEQVMSAPFASSTVASPTGAAVAWILNEQGKRNIWVASGPEWKGRKVTRFDADDGQDINEINWAPDGSYLLFTHGGDFENGGENPNPALSATKPEQAIWRVALDGSAPKKLTVGHASQISPKGDIAAFLRGGQIFTLKLSEGNEAKAVVEQKGTQAELVWSPDGSGLAFVSDRGSHSFIAVYRPSDNRLRYLDASSDQDHDPVWSPDGKRIAHVRVPASKPAFFEAQRAGQPWSIRMVDMNTGACGAVFTANPGPGSLFHPIEATHQIFWGAGDRIVFPWEETGWSHLYSVPVNGGSATELTPGSGEVEQVALSGDRKKIYYSANFGDIDRRHLWSVPVSGGAAPKAVTTGERIEWGPTPTVDGSALVYLESSYNERAQAAVLTGNGTRKALAPEATPATFPVNEMVRPQPVMITAADGMQIHGQLFLPHGQAPGSKSPALIFFHGGSRRQMLLGFHYMYYYSNAYSLNQYLANKGYVVLSVNYRSGIGYGLNFREAIDYGARGGSEYNDVMGAGLYMKSRADVDPKRIGVWGGSYGGYLTAMALARASDLFAAGVDFHGVHDWSALRGFYNMAGASGDPAEVRDRQEAARIAFESSPMASMDTWRSPVLLIHGDDDRNVEFAQTVMLVEALRKRHVAFEELIIPNEIHDFLMHRHWLEAYQATADFFGLKLGEIESISQPMNAPKRAKESK